MLNAIIFPLLLTACSSSDCPPCVDNFSDGYTSGYQNGESDGYSDGYQDGYSEGYGEGKEDGTSEGYSDGYQDGYSEGYEDGEEAGSTSEEVDMTINEAIYDIHTEEQYSYLTGNSLDVGGHITGLEEKSKPVPVVITGSRDNRYQTKDVIKYFEDFYDNFDSVKAKKLLRDLDLDINQKLSKNYQNLKIWNNVLNTQIQLTNSHFQILI